MREILCKSVALDGFQADALQKAKAVPLTPLAFEATEEAAAAGLYKLLKRRGQESMVQAFAGYSGYIYYI